MRKKIKKKWQKNFGENQKKRQKWGSLQDTTNETRKKNIWCQDQNQELGFLGGLEQYKEENIGNELGCMRKIEKKTEK